MDGDWLQIGVERERGIYIYIDIHMQIHSVDSKPALLWSQLVPSGLLPLSC